MNSSVGNVVSMATNLEIRDVLKIKIKKKKNIRIQKNYYKNRKFDGVCYHCSRKGHISEDCWGQKYGNNCKKTDKAENATDGDEDDMVLC